MNEVKILGKSGYDDGYYWDYRIDFEYKDRKFKFIDTGSYSGYIPYYRGIMILKGDEEFLEGSRDCDSYDEPTIDLHILKEYAELCISNNGEYEEEEDDE